MTIKSIEKGLLISCMNRSQRTVHGTLAVGVSVAQAAGTSASPKMIAAQKSYIGLSPGGSNVYYQLPALAVFIISGILVML